MVLFLGNGALLLKNNVQGRAKYPYTCKSRFSFVVKVSKDHFLLYPERWICFFQTDHNPTNSIGWNLNLGPTVSFHQL